MYQIFRNVKQEALRGMVDVLFEKKHELLVEDSSIVKHLEHLEDLVMSNKDKFINTVKGILKITRQHEGGNDTLVVEKIDGMLALFFLLDPRTGTLGVSTKSIGAKAQKIYHSSREMKDIEPDLKSKLEIALQNLKNLPLGGKSFQGDVLFTKEMVHKQRIKGKDYLTFTPNVLMYAVAVDNQSELYQKISNSEFGIVVHTVYDVETVGDAIQLNYTKNDQSIYDLVEKGNNIKGLFITHPYHPQIRLDIDEKKIMEIEKLLMNLDKIKYKMPSVKTKNYFNQYINNEIKKSGTVPLDAKNMVKEFISFLEEKKIMEMNKRKTDKGKQSVENEFNNMQEEVGSNIFDNFAQVYIMALKIKIIFVGIFKNVHSKIGATFFQKDKEFESTGPEGFILATDDGGIVKLVDRSIFSRTNFLFGRFNKGG